MAKIYIFTTGGTIDKVYFDALSEFQVGESGVGNLLAEANISDNYAITPLMKKDSLELSDDDRAVIRAAVTGTKSDRVLITHGTDTMAQTARYLEDIPDKTIVLTGAMLPATHRATDAVFNIGFAIAALSLLPSGVFLAMNGKVFDPKTVVKDRSAGVFKIKE